MYAKRIAETLASQGHTVTVLTSRYQPELADEEEFNGVRVVRVPVLKRVSKGVLMPRYPYKAWELIRQHDLVNIHLPQIEAAPVALLAQLAGRPVVLTYHCDLRLPKGLLNRLVEQVVVAGNLLSALMADALVTYTEDYARHSRFLGRFVRKLWTIPPPIDMAQATAAQIAAFQSEHQLRDKTPIGFAARFASEKGVEYLLAALPRILQAVPDAHVLFAGPYNQAVLGEEEYWHRLQPLLAEFEDHWTFLGVLPPQKMAALYAACAVTVLPSINSTESFGLVQVESMLCGTPVCASDLPGVRIPIKMTGMGKIVPPKDAHALADAVVDIIRHPQRYRRTRDAVAVHYSCERSANEYGQLFDALGQAGIKVSAET
jgi:glycosyltransferase involved in cell wall biosynthesis